MRRWTWVVALVSMTVLCCCTASHSRAQVVISEFMARNSGTLDDGDGNSSDWIELYNTGGSDVDLAGWFLSDDTNDLQRWTFPATNIAAESYMVVFASGQDVTNYVDSLGYLHTTFKLSGDGESVLLTRPDGVTVEHSITDYPAQSDDISYGFPQESAFAALVVEEQDAKALIPTSEPASTWNTIGYTDTSWLSGQTGVGFEQSGSTYGSMINLDVSGLFPGKFTCYIRVGFEVTDLNAISLLTLRMKYDDGFIAYINGTEVASANAPASPGYNDQATGVHDGTTYEDFTLSNPSSYLQAGDNVLAIHALDKQAPPPDLFIMPILTGITAGGDFQTDSVQFLDAPTPGSANVTGVDGFVADTKFSVDRGFFTNTFDVAISCATEGAAIYYTVDGTTPATDNGTLYAGAITVDRTTVLRAAAFVTGFQPSDTDTQTYIFLDDIIAQRTSVTSLAPDFPTSSVNGQGFDYGMDPDIVSSGTYASQIEGAMLALPSISIVTDPDNLFDSSRGIYVNPESDGAAWERETSVELINPDGTDGFQINGGVRIRGGVSRQTRNPKHSFRLFFRSEYGTARLNHDLFGDEGADSYKRIDLRTGQNYSWQFMNPAYSTWLYDIFSRDTQREMGQNHTRGRYYHLYLNGMYWGLYQTEERPDSRFGESYHGGDSDDYDAVKADGDSGVMYAADGTRDAYDDLWAKVSAGVSGDAAYFRIQGMNADGSENGTHTRLLDVESVIDYMLCIFYTGNRDSPIGPPGRWTQPRNLNCVYNRVNSDGFKFIAHDNEHSMEVNEGVNTDRVNQSLSSSFSQQNYFTPWWLHLQLLNNDEYKLKFADHIHAHFFNDGVLTAAAATARMEARRDEIYEAVVAESARWGDSATASPRTRDGDWTTAVNNILNNYIQASPSTRTQVVLQQLVNKGWYPTVNAPEFNQHGGSIASGFSLSISGTSQIFYTTDGSDPREVGGAVAGTAYGSALTLTSSTQVKARTLSGGTWSALTEATFVLNTESPLRVTEIMYNAVVSTGVGTNYVGDDFEFIELRNTGTEAIGLAGTEFSEGIYFDFRDGDIPTLGAGEYVVLVSDYDAFTLRYTAGEAARVAGEYRGRFFNPNGALANGGEGITLTDGLGRTIQRFTYNDWYEITDGEGFSLTLMDSTADTNTWDDSTAWRPSAYSGGTPGSGPVDFPAPGDLVINEALTHQDQDNPGDWIELHNTSTNVISVNSWYVSDDEDNLAKVQLTGLSSVLPGDYLVLTERDHFGTGVAGTNGFALSELGDAIYLSSADGGELTGYRLEMTFGAADRNVTFGRHTKSDGGTDFTAQSTSTSASSNAYPRVGPIVVTELLYRPESNAFEFIELCNTASTNVPLYDTARPTNTWKLEGAVEFTFPEGITLDPGSCILITETNAAAFTNVYTVPAGVTVLGPYDGKLDNAGEEVRVTRPGEPEAVSGDVPYILDERVDYDNAAPWPVEANTGGVSLARVNSALYGNDPDNWTSSSNVTPGTVDGVDPNPDADGDGMPDNWETSHFGGTDEANGGAQDDWDGDGASNLDESRSGTNPTNAASVFALVSIQILPDPVISWLSATGKHYNLWTSTNLLAGFGQTRTAIPATPPLNTLTTTPNEASCLFYRLTVDDE